MNKLILAACIVAFAGVASAQIGLGGVGLGLGGAGLGLGGLGGLGGWGGELGYGIITAGPSKLGWGNVGNAVNNVNIHGYNLRTAEHGPRGSRVHNQAAIAPVFGGHGIGIIG